MSTPLPLQPRTDRTPERAHRFTYGPLEIDEGSGFLRCHYALDNRSFTEAVSVGESLPWSPVAREAARLVHLLAGVSYYKAGAPEAIDLGETPVRPGEREFLRDFFIEGLGEFAYRNGLDLRDLEIVGGRDDAPSEVYQASDALSRRPLVPFGGGIDSLVTTSIVAARRPDTALFVVQSPVARFAAIDNAAASTGLPVLSAERHIDPELISLARSGTVLNGHVPVTAVISSIAVLAAALQDRGEVIMSNEWSASRANLEAGGHSINHQYSKSYGYETAFRSVLAGSIGGAVDWFSLLRPFSELWVARRFAELTRYHHVVHSCNRAFYLDPAKRIEGWCGRCDKCCFIDLILAPFMSATDLGAVFGGREPLCNESLLGLFEALLGLGQGLKPFECVGDVDECRTAVTLAAERPDRAGNAVLGELLNDLGDEAVPARAAADSLLEPLGRHAIPSDLFAAALG